MHTWLIAFRASLSCLYIIIGGFLFFRVSSLLFGVELLFSVGVKPPSLPLAAWGRCERPPTVVRYSV
jgi:hypothetical protein